MLGASLLYTRCAVELEVDDPFYNLGLRETEKILQKNLHTLFEDAFVISFIYFNPYPRICLLTLESGGREREADREKERNIQ